MRRSIWTALLSLGTLAGIVLAADSTANHVRSWQCQQWAVRTFLGGMAAVVVGFLWSSIKMVQAPLNLRPPRPAWGGQLANIALLSYAGIFYLIDAVAGIHDVWHVCRAVALLTPFLFAAVVSPRWHGWSGWIAAAGCYLLFFGSLVVIFCNATSGRMKIGFHFCILLD